MMQRSNNAKQGRSSISNIEIAKLFDEIAELLEIDGENPFRIRAYRNAARAIRDYPEPLTEFVKNPKNHLWDLPAIGKDLGGKILEIIETGSFELLKTLRTKFPSSLRDLLQVRGLGPKKVTRLYNELGIQSIDDLRRAATNHRLENFKGFGRQTSANILASLELLSKKSSRILLSEAATLAESLIKHMQKADGLQRLEIVGSYRRRKETVGDLDILGLCKAPAKLMDQLSTYEAVGKIEERGDTRMTVRLKNGFQVDLRIIPAESWGAALIYFTGSKDHNIELRRRGIDLGLKINEYGVFRNAEHIAGKTEEDVYASVKLVWIPPEMREMKNEFVLAAGKQFPRLIVLQEILGDLHTHTSFTDGQHSIQEMAAAAIERGYNYYAFTDHSKRVSVANGMNSRTVEKYWESIDNIQNLFPTLKLLKGIEVDILDNGSLDLPDHILKKADWVVAAVHYNQKQSKTVMTKRLIKAITNPLVSALAHPSGRLIGTRDAYEADFGDLFKAAADSRCHLEINGQPARLDLNERLLDLAMQHDILFVLNSDAHSRSELGFMQYAVDQARRAGLPPEKIVNTRTWPQILKLK